MVRKPLVVASVLVLGLIGAFSAPALAQQKQPPSCAAISFRPLEGNLSSTPETAGHYRSRFGTIDVLGAQENGKPSYKVQVNRKPLKPLAGDIPQATYPCLNSKNVKTPPQKMAGTCDGSRFRVAVDNSGQQKLIMLFALNGNEWRLCEAGTPQS